MKRKIKNLFHLITAVFSVIYYRYPARKMVVIGVTGTDGKTTTCHLIYHLLKSAGYPVGLISTVGAYFNDQQVDTGFHITTPNAFNLQRLIYQMKRAGVTHLVLEVTSHALDQHRVFGCNFTVGVLTNITHDHLDYFKTMDNLVIAKSKLLTSAKIAIINKNDSSYAKIKSQITRAKRNISIVEYPGSNIDPLIRKTVGVRFVEPYNQLNAEAAVLAIKNIGIPVTKIVEAIKTFPSVSGRMEFINAGQNFTAIVDFAHTPNALENVLTTLKKNKKQGTQLICVFGCPSKRDIEKRPLMGSISSNLADILILTADDPRFEDVENIARQIASGATKSNYYIEPDRRNAIEKAIRIAKKGDIVIFCGKGHEKTISIRGEEIPWSDQEVVLSSIRSLLMPRSVNSDDK